MKKIIRRTIAFFNAIKSKIAFYPALLALVGIGLALLMMSIEQSDVSSIMKEFVPQLIIENGDTALTILSVCIGGLISMMVFSFSMVMLLLSQASSNFSPRLLPGLISDKTHQIILGLYLATILYNIFVLFSVEPDENSYSLPGLAILIGITFTLICLCAFIYFIHNISQSIQINNILDDIFDKSLKRLSKIIRDEKDTPSKDSDAFEDTSNWNSYSAKKCGYLQNISIQNVLNFCKARDIKIYITQPKGFFVQSNGHFIKTNKELEEKSLNELYSYINFSRSELVEDNYILAFKQITEIAVKAMSPGINDPGTAVNSIDYLTELFALRLKKSDNSIYFLDNELYLKIATVDFSELIYTTMASLRTYCKHDPVIVQKLLLMLNYLYEQQAYSKKYKECIEREIKLLIDDAKNTFESSADIDRINALDNT
ncbi:DUF2254 domain-containing protein [Pukyongia salina]|uniref:DUF2254 domain-containing protein n=1 Tax=Pukyongia salina TaxID=2094025 RepID=A0A2S0HTA3_9FLAO|nr:DUF2254 domain-containing protein [Pukyongia salina]AVI49814.1 DUF2254 domain-containing protein [Pukyongia salina]